MPCVQIAYGAIILANIMREDIETQYQMLDSGNAFVRRVIAQDRPLLTAEEEFELAQDIEMGLIASHRLENLADSDRQDNTYVNDLQTLIDQGAAAKNRFIEDNLKFAIHEAAEIKTGQPFKERLSLACIALIRAVEGYDYTKGNKFSTYATWWFKNKIINGSFEDNVISIPPDSSSFLGKIIKASKGLEQENGRPASDFQIAERLGEDEKAVNKIRQFRAAYYISRLDAPVGEDGATHGSFIADDHDLDHEMAEYFHKQSVGTEIRRIVNDLRRDNHLYPPIIRLYFGFDEEPKTLAQISRILSKDRHQITACWKEIQVKLREQLQEIAAAEGYNNMIN